MSAILQSSKHYKADVTWLKIMQNAKARFRRCCSPEPNRRLWAGVDSHELNQIHSIGGFRGGVEGAAAPPFLSCNLPLSVVIIIQSGFNFILFRSFPYLNISCVDNYNILSSIEYTERLQLKPLP